MKDDHQNEGMHAPDWDRFGIKGPSAYQPVGDPTRWGAQVFTALTDATPIVVTPQILQVATRDGYARSWSLLGTLSLPTITWDTAKFVISLQITMGVGQIQIVHIVDLLFPAGQQSPGAGSPAGGLCITQNWYQGGPYETVPEDGGGQIVEARAFAMIGGLIGQSLSVRAKYINQTVAPTPGLPTPSRLGLIVSPYSAGEGL